MVRILILALILIIGIFTAYTLSTKELEKKPLKIYNPVDIQPEMMDRDLVRQGIGHTVGKFSFTDQTGKVFGSKQLTNKIYVAEYFFTTCGTICPRMNAQMQRVQEAFKGNTRFAIVSITVDPETDTVAQMARYAQEHGANNQQWHFLTGKKEDLYRLARRSLFVLKPSEVKNQGDVGSDFIHTNNFVLVDGKKRLRGYYDGTDPQEVDKLIADIKRLLEE